MSPADSPNIVIFDGSPPNFLIFFLTHSRAFIISNVPKFDVLSNLIGYLVLQDEKTIQIPAIINRHNNNILAFN